MFEALTLQLGYNAVLVTLGSAALGVAAGAVSAFLYLRKRALVSDAVSHATLPGLALAFLIMVAFGSDGRFLPGLMVGSALSAWAGLWTVNWITRQTRLPEDAAIGAVLSVFFGFGIVLLTIIQTMQSGRQAGLEGFLLGSTAGMLRSDALVIAAGGALVLLATFALRRPMLMTAFDEGYARVQGLNTARIDMALMVLVLAVTVVGLKIVGLILIVAMLIIPAVAARFWSENATHVALLAALFGGLSGYVGAALSATAPDLPTGPIIVLVAFALFALSLFLAPSRGVLASALRHRRLQHDVHLRQGLLALAHNQPVYEAMTQRMLRAHGMMRADGVPTDAGRIAAAAALQDETRWQELRRIEELAMLASRDDGLTPITDILTADQVALIDNRLKPQGVI
ncbi:Manganese transport system membrane protein MntB [Pelagimonas phthalicica]|uniref:Manganese transport system membrane protein MntB n=1 Tax=Pelagimonas phthalicica TaxID=1037362 RepID=A0A238J8N6_9RHOB|nr:metal ABC transporter permease [Pelagimonas phthalicica]TDS94758.1 manganese/zinc/iron transport system permease protein [Pelagimonas phthalicica]SMX26713.1 Manganese transport system membrane protein MntB [Pelagimonas phthalicica]